MVRTPPSGIASTALTTRLSTTCSICPGSALTLARSGASSSTSVTSSPDEALDHVAQAGGDGAEIDDLGLEDLPAADRQQAPRERGRAIAGQADLGDVAAGRIVLGHPGQHQIGHAVDHRQQVVEVVRDAAGEAADDLHLLRLLQLLLELALLGDVGGRADQAIQLAGVVVHVERAVADPAHRAIGADDAIDLVELVAPRPGVGGLLDALAIVRVHGVHPHAGAGDQALARAAEDRLEGRADVEERAARVGHPEHLLDGLGELAEAILRGAPLLLVALALGDVEVDAGHGRRGPVGVVETAAARRHPAHLAVGQHDAELGAVDALAGRLVDPGGEPGAILFVDERHELRARRRRRALGQPADRSAAADAPDPAGAQVGEPDVHPGDLERGVELHRRLPQGVVGAVRQLERLTAQLELRHHLAAEHAEGVELLRASAGAERHPPRPGCRWRDRPPCAAAHRHRTG